MIRSWLLAARPATLWAAVAPVFVAGTLAAGDDVFSWTRFVVTLGAAVAIQVGVNFANDVADAAKGADTESRIGPTRAVAAGLISPRQMWIGTWMAFGLAAIGGAYLISVAGPVIAIIGGASIVAALGYTNGPRPYGYRGLGEAFVFVFFGLVATVGARFVFDKTAPVEAWLAGIVMGLLATAILLANNIRDIETDSIAGKETLVVRVGRQAGVAIFTAALAGAYVVVVLAVLSGWLPYWSLLSLVTTPLAWRLAKTISTQTAGPPLIAVLKGTARLQLLVGMLLGVGILIQRFA